MLWALLRMWALLTALGLLALAALYVAHRVANPPSAHERRPPFNACRVLTVLAAGLERAGLLAQDAEADVEQLLDAATAKARARVGTRGLSILGGAASEGDGGGAADWLSMRRNLGVVLSHMLRAQGGSGAGAQGGVSTLWAKSNARMTVGSYIGKRLRVAAALAARPHVRALPLRRPVVVLVGTWRTGSTLLHNLLAAHPLGRPVRRWEMLAPTDTPAEFGGAAPDRVKVDTLAIKLSAPDLDRIHTYALGQADECHTMWHSGMMMELVCHLPGMGGALTHYLDGLDARAQYAEQRLALQLLCAPPDEAACAAACAPGAPPAPGYLVLKDPLHSYHLEALAAELPHARFVWLHRDPVMALASACSLTACLREAACPAFANVDLHDVGRRNLRLVSEVFERGLAQRARLEAAGAASFVDVHYKDLVADTFGTLKRLYAELGIGFGAEAEAAVRAFHAEQAALRKKGKRRQGYALAEFGLDEAEVRRRFRPYCERFGVAQEQQRVTG